MEHMYDILKPGGEVLLVFLASNPIFTMYERMAERTEWTEYMKVLVSSFVLSLEKLPSKNNQIVDCNRFVFSFRMSTNMFQNINILLVQLRCLPQLAALLVSRLLNAVLRNAVFPFKMSTLLKVNKLTLLYTFVRKYS